MPLLDATLTVRRREGEGPRDIELLVMATATGMRSHPLEAGKPLVVGRALDSDIRIDDPQVSQKHATFSFDGEQVRLFDTSKNGTFVGGRRVQEPSSVVHPGQTVAIGPALIVVQEAGDVAAGIVSLEAQGMLLGRMDQLLAQGAPFSFVRFHPVQAHPVAIFKTVVSMIGAGDLVADLGEKEFGVLLLGAGGTRAEQLARQLTEKMGPCNLRVVSTSEPHLRSAGDVFARTVDERRPTVQVSVEDSPVAAPAMIDVVRKIERAAPTMIPILLLGETGTGKTTLAQYAHNLSKVTGPFVEQNCAAIPLSLLDSEVFGYVRGAFTGANADKPGLAEMANGGTLFLDEVGELGPSAQAALLTMLGTGTIRRVGSTNVIKTSCRFIAATNKNLAAMVKAGTFRDDLYYRLATYPVTVPPLRERREDLRPIAEALLDRLSSKYAVGNKSLSPVAWQALQAHDWPGNVRELENALARGLINAIDQPRIEVEHLELPGATEEPEARQIREALERNRWNKAATSKELRMSRSTLYNKLEELGLHEKGAHNEDPSGAGSGRDPHGP